MIKRKLKIPIILFLSGIFIISCETEIDIINYQDSVPVIYGIYHLPSHNFGRLFPNSHEYALLSPNYIRLSKSFTGRESAYTMARIPDSVYYKNANLRVEYYGNGSFISSNTLVQTDEFKKNTGIFATNDHIMYKTTDHAVPNACDTIRVVVELQNKISTVSTKYISEPTILKPVFLYEFQKEINLINDRGFEIVMFDKGDYYTIDMEIKI